MPPDKNSETNTGGVPERAAGVEVKSPGLPDLGSISEHYAAIVESSDDAIISKALNGTITSWNRGACEIFGYTAEEMIGRSILTLFPPDRVEEETLITEQILHGEKIDHFDTVRVHKTGRLIDVSVTISPIRRPDGVIIGASKIARDITAQKTAESRLQLAAAVFTHASEAILIVGSAGEIIDVNAAFTTISGYERDEVIGQTSAMFNSSRQDPAVYSSMRRDLSTSGHCQGEVWSRHKDGTAFAGVLTVSAVADENGIIQQYVVIFTDITILKSHQELLEYLAHHDALTDLPNRILLTDRIE